MLEDFPRSLQKVFQSFLPKVVQRDDISGKTSREVYLENTSEEVFSKSSGSLLNVARSLLGYVLQLTIFNFLREDFFRSLPSDDFSRSLLSRAKERLSEDFCRSFLQEDFLRSLLQKVKFLTNFVRDFIPWTREIDLRGFSNHPELHHNSYLLVNHQESASHSPTVLIGQSGNTSVHQFIHICNN
ncbi:hypothetical protein YC2023_117760 [Brassica napus]